MACPNCGDERIEWQNDFGDVGGEWWINLEYGIYEVIRYCPFCGEHLLSPSGACVRWCD